MLIQEKMKLKKTDIKSDNIWTTPVKDQNVIAGSTNLLADQLNSGLKIELIKLKSTIITGTNYFPLDYFSKVPNTTFMLKKGNWVSLNIADNKLDNNAITYRANTLLLDKRLQSNKVSPRILFHNQELIVHKPLFYYVTVGYVPANINQEIKKYLLKYNQFDLPCLFSNSKDKLQNKLTSSNENVVAKVKFVSDLGDHLNYYVDIYVPKIIINKYQRNLNFSILN